MRYIAEVSYEDYLCEGEVSPCIQAAYSTADESLAIRHARAMVAVVRAALAERRAWAALYGPKQRVTGSYAKLEENFDRATIRYRAAVARLEKVEREVGRG